MYKGKKIGKAGTALIEEIVNAIKAHHPPIPQ